MAIGDREAASIPEFAVVIKATMAAALRRIIPVVPMIVLAPIERGINEPDNSPASTIPTVTPIASVYIKVTTKKDKNIPRGIFRAGFRISSAILAIFVSPPNDTKTNPAVATTDQKPFGMKSR